MKNVFLLFLVIIIPFSIQAQNKSIHTEKFSYEQSMLHQEENNFSIPCEGTFQGYYDIDDNFVRHGITMAKGNTSINRYGVSIDGSHSLKSNYKDGSLDGDMLLETSYTMRGMGTKIVEGFSYSARFKNGFFNGPFSLNSSLSAVGHTSETRITANFDQDVMTKIQCNILMDGKMSDEDDNFNLEFTKGRPSGKITSKSEVTTLKYGVCTNKFIRLSGKVSEIESSEKEVIDDIIKKMGEVAASDYLGKGYSLEQKEFVFTKKALEYVNASAFADYPYWSLTEKEKVFPKNSCSYYILKKVRVLDTAMTLAMINNIIKISAYPEIHLSQFKESLKTNEQIWKGETAYYVPKEIENWSNVYIGALLDSIKEAKRIAEEQRIEKLKQNAFLKILNKLSTTDNNFMVNLFQQNENSDNKETPYSGKEQQANTYLNLRKEYGIDTILTKKHHSQFTYIDSINIENFYKALPLFNRFVYKNEYADSLKNNAQKIYELANPGCKDVAQDYNTYFKTFPFNKNFTSTQQLIDYKTTIEDEFVRQKKCFNFINVRNSINQYNSSLKQNYAQFSDAISAYESYFPTLDLSWNKDVSEDKLLPAIDLQKKFEKFVSIRKQIVETDSLIMISGQKYKNIINLYVAYINAQDLSWNANATTAKLTPVVEAQHTLLNGFQKPNISDVNKTIKKQKIESLEEILKLL